MDFTEQIMIHLVPSTKLHGKPSTKKNKKNYDMYCTLHTLAQSTCMCMYVCLFVSIYMYIYLCVYLCIYLSVLGYISMMIDVRLSWSITCYPGICAIPCSPLLFRRGAAGSVSRFKKQLPAGFRYCCWKANSSWMWRKRPGLTKKTTLSVKTGRCVQRAAHGSFCWSLFLMGLFTCRSTREAILVSSSVCAELITWLNVNMCKC